VGFENESPSSFFLPEKYIERTIQYIKNRISALMNISIAAEK